MKKSIRGYIAFGIIIAGIADMASAADAGVTLDFASAYLFRGVTLNDGPVVQPGVEVAVTEGLALGVWGNVDLGDYGDSLQRGQFSELDIYASYSVTLPDEKSGVKAGYTEYTYPGGGSEADREFGLTYSYDTIASPYVSAFYGIDGAVEKTLYLEAGVSHDIDLDESGDVTLGLSGLVGYLDPDEGRAGFNQYKVGVSLTYKLFYIKGYYVGQLDDEVLADVEDGGGYDVGLFGMAGMSFSF